MTGTEILQEFNLLYNNIDSNAVPGLEPYEISWYLTKAQDELLKNYFNPAGNKYKQGFDGSTKRQIDFSKLIRVSSALVEAEEPNVFDRRAIQYILPSNILFIIDEELEFTKANHTYVRQVIPLSYDEYTRLMSKPFKEPLRGQAWRLIGNPDTATDTPTTIEVIPNINDRLSLTSTKEGEEAATMAYKVRYVKKPQPILLDDFSSRGLSIEGVDGSNGYNLDNPCELDPSIHHELVQRAVELAKAGYMSDQTNIQTQMGTRSE